MGGPVATVVPGPDEYSEEMKAVFDPTWEAGDWRRTWPDPPEHQ